MRLGTVLWVIATCAAQLNAQQPALLRKLVPVAGHLAGGDSLAYSIKLKPGQYVEATVEQKSVDVVVRLTDPAGKHLLEIDSPNGASGPESVFYVADAAGSYRLEVTAPKSGDFEVKLIDVRKPSDNDRTRAGALLAYSGAAAANGTEKRDGYARAARLFHSSGPERSELYALQMAADASADRAGSLEFLQQAVALQQRLGPRHDLQFLASKLASVLYDLQRNQEAVEAYRLVLAVQREENNRDAQASTLSMVGLTYGRLKQYNNAMAAYEEELSLRREIKDRHGEGEALFWLGSVYADVEQYQKAILNLEGALAIQTELKDARGAVYTRNALGRAHAALGEHDKALACYQAVLELRRESHDRGGEAASLHSIGSEYSAEQKIEQSIGAFQQELSIRRETKDRAGEATALLVLGASYEKLNQLDEAISSDRQAAVIFRELRNRSYEALAMLTVGRALLSAGNATEAKASLEGALAITRDIKDRGREADALNLMGKSYHLLYQDEKAVDYHQQALAIVRERHDQLGEAGTLTLLGASCNKIHQRDKAMAYLEQALDISRRLQNRAAEAEALSAIGIVEIDNADYLKAGGVLDKALAMFREMNNQRGVATCLSVVAQAYQRMGQFGRAIQSEEQALALQRNLRDRRSEATLLSNLGYGYSSMGQFEQAITYYQQSLDETRELNDRWGESVTLSNLGWAYSNLAQFQKALDYYDQAFAIQDAVKGQRFAGTLGYAGLTYSYLGQYQKALGYLQQALALDRENQDRQAEATSLSNIAAEYRRLGKFDDAIRYGEQALAILREVKDRGNEGATVGELGNVYYLLGQYDKAVQFHEQALAIEREVKDRRNEAAVLSVMGYTYRALKQYNKALAAEEQALAIGRETGSRDLAAEGMAQISLNWSLLQQPRLAIFYGKQAVNELQAIRTDIRGLAQDTQRSFASAASYAYRNLADMLIAGGRLSEGQQVINLLKDDEYLSFVRRDKADASSLDGRADLTADESEWAQRYRAVSDKLTALGARYQELLAVRSLSPEQNAEMDTLQKDLSAGNQAFQQFLEALNGHFTAKIAAGSKGVAELQDTEALEEMLGKVGHGAVAIYTLAGEDKFRAILVTSSVQRAYEYPITAADLNRKIQAFRQAVQDPRVDPRPLGRELYNILLVPALAADLRQAKAETLMWSLDGALRYLPLAALYDGQHYLIEKYRLAVFTPASQTRLEAQPARKDWKLVGFGVTQAHQGFSALPNVSGELGGIVRNAGDEELLDAKFTGQALTAELRRGFPLVHIASHFNFQPGNEEQSFLLLGDGAHLSLAEVKNTPKMFTGVDLLTLSACNTGVGDGGGDGREVEGFGVIAQRKGAGAVIAALWPVADESTSLLMREFYRLLESTPGMMKAEALRQAQLELLSGKVKPGSSPADARGVAVAGAPFSVGADFAHPYYWAPFFLMGNWL